MEILFFANQTTEKPARFNGSRGGKAKGPKDTAGHPKRPQTSLNNFVVIDLQSFHIK